jgi:predicted metal-dependent phosphoesterase TrpH
MTFDRTRRLSSRCRPLFPPALCVALSLLGLAIRAATPAKPSPPAPKWFRGNTHVHTVLCGHADSTPEAVAKWYLDRGYHFLCLSEHNRFIDPAMVALPEGRRSDFILIPGEEITGTRVHMTGLNVRGLVIPVEHPNRSRTIQTFTDRTRAAGGTPIINHPNFG